MVDKAMCLLDCPLGQQATLCQVAAEPAVRRRLAELGLRCGARVVATQRTAGGGCVVATGDTRVALDRVSAASLSVTTAA
jgi:ferrous iron transport protein A